MLRLLGKEFPKSNTMKAYFSALVKGGSGKLMHSSCEEVSNGK
jgi:hypothetical protein